MTTRRLSACFLIGVLALGCGRIQRTRQCKQVVKTVNTALDEIAERQDAGVGNSAGERELASRYEKLAGDLQAHSLDSQTLARTVAEYCDVLRETGQLLRRIAEARDRNEPLAIGLAKRELANSTRRDKMLVMRIDSACQSP